MVSKDFAIFLVALGVIIHSTEAVICYSCNSGLNVHCEDQPEQITDTCTGKTCMKAAGTVAGIKVTIRTCQDRDHMNGCYTTEVSGITVFMCSCTTDYCNSGPVTGKSLATFRVGGGAKVMSRINVWCVAIGLVLAFIYAKP